jgi:hypothetical protein
MSIDVDERVKNETREFFYEALLLLERSQSNSRIDEEEESVQEIADSSAKHVILYAFLALSLVRDAERDVAAVAVYQMKNRVHVYFTKNSLNDTDTTMAKRLVKLICDAARDRTIESRDFHEHYFRYITESCASKFNKRFDQMTMNILKSKRDGDLMPSTTADLENLLASLDDTMHIQL